MPEMPPPPNTGRDGTSAQTPQQMARRDHRMHPLPQASAGGQRSQPEHKANQRIRRSAAARALTLRGSRIEDRMVSLIPIFYSLFSILYPRSSILDPRPSILNPQSSILDPRSPILNPRSSILDPRPSILADVFPLTPVSIYNHRLLHNTKRWWIFTKGQLWLKRHRNRG